MDPGSLGRGAGDEPPSVSLDRGRVVGRRKGPIRVFRGIPYAGPVSGRRRFAPPSPAGEIGVFDASSVGPMAPQVLGALAQMMAGGAASQSEDCLALNVFAPEGERLPVIVFLHGGGFLGGAASSAVYDGSALAAGGVVLVTVNYRLGALGWLGHPALFLDGAGSANWGLYDLLAGLEWVGRNIEAFGGDPARVTLAGESAGAMCVAALLASPAAGRLFHRAILQSGAAVAQGIEPAAEVAEDLARRLGLDACDRASLCDAPLERVVSEQGGVAPRSAGTRLSYQPVIDGGLLSAHPALEIARHGCGGVDIMIGTNRDEWNFWALTNPALRLIDEGRLHDLVRDHLSIAAPAADTSEVVEVYRAGRGERDEPAEPKDLYAAIATDWSFRVPALRLAEAASGGGSRVYSYLFDWRSPFAGGALGSCHALELPFVFGTLTEPPVSMFTGTGERAAHLSRAMIDCWTSFAASGQPSCSEVPRWPRYEVPERSTLRLGEDIVIENSPLEDERRALEETWGPYGLFEARMAEVVCSAMLGP